MMYLQYFADARFELATGQFGKKGVDRQGKTE
jgi:hypothetical protein